MTRNLTSDADRAVMCRHPGRGRRSSRGAVRRIARRSLTAAQEAVGLVGRQYALASVGYRLPVEARGTWASILMTSRHASWATEPDRTSRQFPGVAG